MRGRGSLWRRAARCGAEILPVDSEHSAIFQSMAGRDKSELRRILLTGSGGRSAAGRESRRATSRPSAPSPSELEHGAKISIDSATMMNKGLEFIEAMHLFAVTPDQIKVIIHPESAIHSMVELLDGTVIAQLGSTGYGSSHPVRAHVSRAARVGGEADGFRRARLHAF